VATGSGGLSCGWKWEDHALMTNVDPTERVRTFYRRYAPRYDHQAAWYDRILLGDGRAWACAQSCGAVLEVAIGTGRNLQHYPPDRRLTGIDLTPAMLAIAHNRARELGVAAALLVADAQALPFGAASFDSVVCTLGLNAIPDDQAAVVEMYRVVRPGGRLVLLGHVASPTGRCGPYSAGSSGGCCRSPATTRPATRCRCCGRPGSSLTATSGPGWASSSGW
jgi:ubiquinone/menaquinone biosynthesis C-methylase UbiE